MIFVYGILGLSLVVFFHELGHFVAARLCGIEVLRFSIGIGKRLFGFQFKGTDYCVSLLPIGGYCKMKGENALLEAFGKGGEIEKEPGSFYAAHPLKRILVSFMGPFFNILFAALCFSVVAFIGYTIDTVAPRILLSSEYPDQIKNEARYQPYPADKAGLRSGDLVLAIDGAKIATFTDFTDIVHQKPEKTLLLEIDRGGRRLTVPVTSFLDRDAGVGRIGVTAWVDPVLAKLRPGGPASAAGLKPGDRIESIDGKPVRASADIDYALRSHPGSVRLGVRRAGSAFEATLAPVYKGRGDKTTIDLGLEYGTLEEKVSPKPLFPGIAQGFADTANTISLTFKGIALLVKLNLNKALAGFLRMTYMMGSAAESGFSQSVGSGFVSMLQMMAIISIGLFITNLLPLPILDGGLIIMFLVEMVRKKTFTAQTIYRVTMVGLFLLVGIFLFTTFNDIISFIPR